MASDRAAAAASAVTACDHSVACLEHHVDEAAGKADRKGAGEAGEQPLQVERRSGKGAGKAGQPLREVEKGKGQISGTAAMVTVVSPGVFSTLAEPVLPLSCSCTTLRAPL